MLVRHAHAGVKLILQAELCVGKTASIYIGMHAWWFGKCRDACVACALVRDACRYATSACMQCVHRLGRSAT